MRISRGVIKIRVANEHAMEMAPDANRPIAEPDELKLGAPESKTASISWLGVIEKPEEGEAPIDEVEQAALTTKAGAGRDGCGAGGCP